MLLNIETTFQELAGPRRHRGGHRPDRDGLRGDPPAAIQRLEDRIAQGFVSLVHVLDPNVIVIGGGLSRLGSIYRNVPPLLEKYGFDSGIHTPIVPAFHEDSSGVRGAAWLWPRQK